MPKEYARFKKYFESFKGWIYESVREDGRIFWKIMHDKHGFINKDWKVDSDYEEGGSFVSCPESICQFKRECDWQQIKGPQSVTSASQSLRMSHDRKESTPTVNQNQRF